MNRLLRMTVIPLVVLLSVVSIAAAQTTQPVTQFTFDQLTRAIEDNDRDGFLASATDEMKAALTPALMKEINTDLGPALVKGFTATYVGQLHQRGMTVDLWKIAPKAGGDDVLLRIVMKDNLLAGFFRE